MWGKGAARSAGTGKRGRRYLKFRRGHLRPARRDAATGRGWRRESSRYAAFFSLRFVDLLSTGGKLVIRSGRTHARRGQGEEAPLIGRETPLKPSDADTVVSSSESGGARAAGGQPRLGQGCERSLLARPSPVRLVGGERRHSAAVCLWSATGEGSRSYCTRLSWWLFAIGDADRCNCSAHRVHGSVTCRHDSSRSAFTTDKDEDESTPSSSVP